MATSAVSSRSMRLSWAATWVVPIAAQVVVAVWFASSIRFRSAEILFFAVTFAAAACVIASAGMIRRSFRTNDAELGFLGAFFYAASVLPLVHGITTPGMVVGSNTATSFSILLAVPVGLLSIAPFVVRGSGATPWLRRQWRGWIAVAVAGATALSAGMLVAPDAWPAVEMRDPLTIAIGVASALCCVLLSLRQLALAQLAQRRSPLVVSFGFGMVGASALVWLTAAPYDAGFWVAHVLDIGGVMVGTVGAIIVFGRSATMEQVVGPVLLTEPLSALAVGMDPIVHRFVADLEAKDLVTRDHVIRTTELAVRVGEEMRLGALQLRDLGLAAILHDVGKVGIPDEILNKPGRLTPGEFDIMREHTEIGERMVRSSPVLASIAPAVRGHHERMDGGGYPDGLAGHEIPQNARIVAVCDAYDAMANTRQYRAGMGHDKAIAILREHSGSQWDPVAVEALVMTLARRPITEELHIQIDRIGRESGLEQPTHLGCDCLPAVAFDELDRTNA